MSTCVSCGDSLEVYEGKTMPCSTCDPERYLLERASAHRGPGPNHAGAVLRGIREHNAVFGPPKPGTLLGFPVEDLGEE